MELENKSIPISIKIDHIPEEIEVKFSALIEAAVRRVLAEKEPVRYFTLHEAAKYTKKAISTIYTDHSRGRLKAFKSGRHLRFTEDQLQAYLEGR